MQTLSGHLTSTEKSHIKAILNAGLNEGKINRKTYHLTQNDGFYSVSITEMLTAWCEVAPKLTTNKHTFKL